MGKAIGGGNVVLYYGVNNLTTYFNQASISRDNDLKDVTDFADTSREYAKGLNSGGATLTGLYDDTAANIDAILNTAFAAAAGTVLTIGPVRDTIGRAAYLLLSQKSKYEIPARVEEIVALAADIQADGGVDRGIWLHAAGAETGTVNSASVDNSASSSNGGVAHLHVSAITATSVTVKIQHSANDSTWADLATFAAFAPSTGSERLVVAAGTTVDRYVRCIISTFVGTTVTYAVAFARR